MANASTAYNVEVSLGDRIDRLHKVKDLIKERTKKHLTPLKDEQIQLEETIIAKLDELGVPNSGGRHATCSIQEAEVFSVEDPAKFESWIYRHKLLAIMQVRLSNPNVRDFIAAHPRSKLESAGIRKFTKRTIGTNKRVLERAK